MDGKRVLIVGAGPGGLASSMLLAQAGFEVKLIERMDRVGGRCSALRQNGFTFDVGPTFFLYPRILEEILRTCGFDLFEEHEFKRLDPQYHLVFEQGGEIRATPDVQRMKREIASIRPADAENLERYLCDNRAKLAAFRPILENPFLSWRHCLRPSVLKSLPLVRPRKSMDRDLQTYFSDPRVRLAFSFQSKYLGMSPFQCPSLFTILSFLEYEYGVFHPVGGCGALSETMGRLARRMGVELSLNDPVESLMFEPGTRHCVGVKSASGEHRADAVLLNADFAESMRQLVPDRLRRRWTDAKLEKKKFSCSTFMIYLGLEGHTPELEHHTIFLARDYERNLREVERDHVLSENPSFYVQNACRTDPTLAPPDCTALYVLAPVSHEHPNIDWAKQAPAFREKVLDQLGKLGLSDVRPRIKSQMMLTPETWRRDYRIYRGATFNLAHSLDQMLHLRPRNRFEDLKNVYLTGGGTHPGSGLPVIFESARITSRLIVQDLRSRSLAGSRPTPATPPADVREAELVG